MDDKVLDRGEAPPAPTTPDYSSGGGSADRRARDLLQALPAAVYTTNAAGQITFYNRAAVELWGCTPELGSTAWCGSLRLYTPDGQVLAHDECPMAVALRESRPLRAAETVVERPDGTRVPLLAFPTPLYDATGRLTGAVNMLVDIRERKRAERQHRLLLDELNHRVKNTLATVMSLAVQTGKTATSVGEFNRKFQARIQALSKSHELLTRERWEGTDIGDVLKAELRPYFSGSAAPRITLDGPTLRLDARASVSLALVVHELATNAAKYGSLSGDGGVSISWEQNGLDPHAPALLIWREFGGPPVTPPERKGFGTVLIQKLAAGDLGGDAEIDYRPEGLTARITLLPDAATA